MTAADLEDLAASPETPFPEEARLPGIVTRIGESDLPEGCTRRLWAWWAAAARQGRPPRREDFDPVEFPRILGNITIFDVERDPWRFRVRLVGTRIVEETDRDTTGVYLDELENAGPIALRARWVAENRRPYYLPQAPVVWTSRDFKHYATLALPLVDATGETGMILYHMDFF